ncbi:Tubulin-tyrosine ligase/Tubulin polyglutamylase [Trypanosoma melophagium]|uniref:Tubulin-tyrosine ligase/Tubulin polyglutamylase n=1 Tax=Trypanosoma melophagium TaxID=715481 RepID=UPI00351A9E22|nr:Tubulin-tyrosine ligase/Tubulin polyglutamylase [Trypanosoma melophagium]
MLDDQVLMTFNGDLVTPPEQNPLPPPPPKQSPRFFLGDSSFSVYEDMGVYLRQLGWNATKSKAQMVKCDLILGDRFTIPYSVLRCEPLVSSSYYGGYRWINYFRGSHRLTLKASMARLLQESDATCNEWMPHSFVLGGDQKKRQDDRELFIQYSEEHPDGIWIIKRSSGSKGKDILLVRTLEEIKEFINTLEPNSRSIFVAQKYVDRPLLYQGRKFDIRVWALLKTPYEIYVFSQGSCRTSSVMYDPDDTKNTLAHLTNHCLQEGASQFGQYEVGNELWFPQLGKYLHKVFNENVLERRILPQISNIVVRTLMAMKLVLEVSSEEPYKCFQLFGYDLILDDKMVVQLLEINGSPGVATKFLRPVVTETLSLVNGSDAPRKWDPTAVQFVKLWGNGDAMPDGSARF